MNPPTVAVLTISDRCWGGVAEDTAGPAIVTLLRDRLGARVPTTDLLPDDPDRIAARLIGWAEDPAPDLVLTVGGTGLGPRDHTPEATLRVLERRHPALLELARLRCYQHAPLACLSRGEAGTVRRTLVLNLPGSRRGATETLEALLDVLPHAIAMLRGEDHPASPGTRGGSNDG